LSFRFREKRASFPFKSLVDLFNFVTLHILLYYTLHLIGFRGLHNGPMEWEPTLDWIPGALHFRTGQWHVSWHHFVSVPWIWLVLEKSLFGPINVYIYTLKYKNKSRWSSTGWTLIDSSRAPMRHLLKNQKFIIFLIYSNIKRFAGFSMARLDLSASSVPVVFYWHKTISKIALLNSEYLPFI
jgi:hypothetical protein